MSVPSANSIMATLEFAARNGFNVLLNGPAGVGKTAMVHEVFTKVFGKDGYLVLAAATIDPYADIVGIPYPVEAEDGEKRLGYLRPEIFTDKIQAIFFDEANRGAVKTVNAMMELLQFKRVNGKETGIKVVWGATNPDDMVDEHTGAQVYHVNTLDPAHRDRFHFHIDVPVALDAAYFRKTFGAEIFQAAHNWWNGIDPKIKKTTHLSPRRVDYALQIHMQGGDIRYVLPSQTNPDDLRKRLATVTVQTVWKKALADNDSRELERLINGTDAAAIMSIVDSKTVQTYLSHVNPDKLDTMFENYPDKFMVRVENDDARLNLCQAAGALASEQATKFVELNESFSISQRIVDDIVRNGANSGRLNKMDNVDEAASVIAGVAQFCKDAAQWPLIYQMVVFVDLAIQKFPELQNCSHVAKLHKALKPKWVAFGSGIGDVEDRMIDRNQIPSRKLSDNLRSVLSGTAD